MLNNQNEVSQDKEDNLNSVQNESTIKNNSTHPLSSSILKTTKSILDLAESSSNLVRVRSLSSDLIYKKESRVKKLWKKSNSTRLSKNRIFWKPKTEPKQQDNKSLNNYFKIFRNSDKKSTLPNVSGLLSVNLNMDEIEPKVSQTNSPSSFDTSMTSPELSVIVEGSNGYQNNSKLYLVEIRAVILKIGEIDTLNEKFYAEAFVEAKWIDNKLDPSTKYNPDTDWNPCLYVLNCLDELKQQVWYNQYSIGDYEKEEMEKNNQQKPSIIDENRRYNLYAKKEFLKSSKNGSVILERRRISGQFWQTLNLKNFPADVQNLTISISSLKQANEIQLYHSKDKPSTVNIKCFVDSQEWRLYKHITVREYLKEVVFSSESFQAIDLTINVARKPTFYYWNAFFLIFLITLSSLSIFSIRCHLNANRIQSTSTLLLTSVTFKWITNRSLPTVSYMTSLDKYSIACMLLLCAQCVWHSFVSSIMDLEQKCDFPFSYYDHIAFVFFASVFLFVQVVFIIWLLQTAYKKRRQLNRQELDFTNEIMGKRSTRLKSMLYGI